MKNKRLIDHFQKILWCFSVFSLIFIFVGCSDDKDEQKECLVIDEEEQTIVLEAEETYASINFTALTSWEASFKEPRDWLSLSSNSGIGGLVTLKITLEKNSSEDARYATIILSCGNSSKEISVTQGGSQLRFMDESDVVDFEKYYKPSEFKSIDMFRSDAKWSWFRHKQSEHFFVFWEPGFGDDPNSEALDASLRVDIEDLLDKAELFFRTNIEKLKFAEIGQNKSNLDKYKMQIYLHYTTEWMAYGSGYDDTIGALWVNPATCKPVGSTIAHEIGHSFQYQVYCDKLLQGAAHDFKQGFRYGYDGSNGGNAFWEQCAQWQAYQDYPEQLFENAHFNVWLANCHRHFEHEWMRYASYWMQYYWAERRGEGTVANIWKESAYPEDPIATYLRLYYGNQWEAMLLELYDYATRMATFDIDGIRDYAKGNIGKYSTQLYVVADDYYQVSYSSCPGTTGFNVIPLKVPETSTTVSVRFEGLLPGSPLAPDDPGEYMESEVIKGKVNTYNSGPANDKGWRYGFVALLEDGTREYGEMNQKESHTVNFTVPSNTQKLFFVVLGAPKKYKAHPWDEKELNDAQWPYKVKFNNTDLLGSVNIDPNAEPENITLTYNVSFAPSSEEYKGGVVNLNDNEDIAKIAQALVMQPTTISGLFLPPKSMPEEGKIAFAAIKSDGTLDYDTTANGLGFWFNSKGNPTVWGEEDSKLFSEFSSSNFEFVLGQYPNKNSSGDKTTIKLAWVYLKNGKQYQVTFTFNVTIK